MDELEFYKKQYAFLIGEIDRAIGALEDQNYGIARQSLTNALSAAESRWISTFAECESEKTGTDSKSIKAAP